MPIKLSIISVNLNNAAGLQKTIESVVNQTFANYEYIIIDGGSTDGSKEIIEKYADKISYWVSEPDKGIYNGMNKGIKVAKGEWLYFLNSDDTFFSNNILSFFISKFDNFDFVYGNIRRCPSEIIYDGEFNYQKLLYSNISHQAIFYKRIVLIDLGMYNQKYIVGADYAINILIFTKGYRIKFVEKIVANYNENGISAYTFDEFFFYDVYKNFINPFKKFIDKEQIVRKTWDIFRLILLSGKLNKFREFLFLIKISIFSKSIGGFYLGIKKMLK